MPPIFTFLFMPAAPKKEKKTYSANKPTKIAGRHFRRTRLIGVLRIINAT